MPSETQRLPTASFPSPPAKAKNSHRPNAMTTPNPCPASTPRIRATRTRCACPPFPPFSTFFRHTNFLRTSANPQLPATATQSNPCIICGSDSFVPFVRFSLPVRRIVHSVVPICPLGERECPAKRTKGAKAGLGGVGAATPYRRGRDAGVRTADNAWVTLGCRGG